MVKWSVRDLAEASAVHRNTISAFETDQTAPNNSTLAVLRGALEAAGVVFIDENSGGAGVRLKFNRRDVKAIDVLENEGGPVGEDDR
ncbi:helix-turn-helix domain-containing protein [Mesorhizobium sp. IMUNJ 23232]|uniref:helix-turn-helix domain-containing protein n=1 Tax=Mesorhizobium sp. IMUNJ 23232 TaxID=3376064 RepID=UPI0037B76D45